MLRRRSWFVSLLCLCLTYGSAASAQDWTDISVPTAALALVGGDTSQGRALTLARLLRALHDVPFDDDHAPVGYLDLRVLLRELDELDTALRRAPGGISLAMATAPGERDVLNDVAERLGVRVRERQRQYTVEPRTGKDDVALRERLAKAGIDVAALIRRINAGETVRPRPATQSFPLPLPVDAWGRLLGKPLTVDTVFAAIVLDRRASLLYLGLSAMSADTRRFLATVPELLTHWLDDAAPAVAANGGAFRVDASGRVVPAGGSEATELWEDLVGAPLSDAAEFGRRLFDREGGRLAWFYNTVAHLDVPRQRFALGLWMPPAGRRERFRVLANAFVNVDPNVLMPLRPFARPLDDAATLLEVVAVTSSGEPVPPVARRLWARALDGQDLPAADSQLRAVDEDGSIDAAWLVEQLPASDATARKKVIQRLSFGQRVFANAGAASVNDALIALRAFGRYPTLALTLERMGVREPALYAAMARAAERMEHVGDVDRAIVLLGQFQGTLAVLDRVSRSQSWPRDKIDALVSRLAQVAVTNDAYRGRLIDWIVSDLAPALVPASSDGGESLDARLTGAMAMDAPRPRPFEWEGETYIPELGAAERRRFLAVRGKQGGNSVDTVLALREVARRLSEPAASLDAVKTHLATLRTVGAKLAPARRWVGGSDEVVDVRKVVDKASRDLGRITRPRDLDKTVDVAEPLTELADALAAETLVALAYVPAIADVSVLSSPDADISRRHHFALTTARGTTDPLAAWQRPRQDGESRVGQSMTGAVLAVDLATSRSRLRRMETNAVPKTPLLNPNYRDAMTLTLSLMEARSLSDEAMNDVMSVLERARARVAGVRTDAARLDDLAAVARIDDRRRALLSWIVANEPDRTESLFSIAELFAIGGALPDAPRMFGVSQEALTGCYCLTLSALPAWVNMTGRPGAAQLMAAVPDVGLRIVEVLAQAGVPSALFPGVMAMALQDFVDTVPALFDDDWLAIIGRAQQITRERVEDYVSALVADGPVRVAPSGGVR